MERGLFYMILPLLMMMPGKHSAQPQSGQGMWATLGRVTFTTQFNPDLLTETSKVTVSPAVEKLHNSSIDIDGYIIPLTGQTVQSHFMLSKYPQSTCFFCGKAGPETAMQVFLKGNRKIKISERKVKVRGTLLVNPVDGASLLYSLENAEVIEE